MSESTRARLIDISVALGVALLLVGRVAVPLEAESPAPDWRSYGIAAGFGVVMLWRRSQPLVTLYGSAFLLMTYYVLGLGAIGAAWPLAPALFNAALYGYARAASWIAAGVLATASAWRLLIENEGNRLSTINDVISEAALATAVILAGSVIVGRRRLLDQMGERERAVEAEREAVARRRVSEERLHIAREVHDVVAHSLAGIGVQARLAEELIDADARGARAAIRSIIDSTSDAMSGLRKTVGSLREEPPTSAPSLEELANTTTGLQVVLDLDVDLAQHPRIDGVVRAVTREAITNSVRHGRASTVTVTLQRKERDLSLSIVDDGAGGPVAVEGNGIRGMRERVAHAGGTLRFGPGTNGGFAIDAEIPL